MTKEEALNAMKTGQRLTHNTFTDSEYIKMVNGLIVCERGYTLNDFWRYRTSNVWETGWSVFSDQ